MGAWAFPGQNPDCQDACSGAWADEQRRELSPLKLRRKARDFALKTIKAQREQFKRCAGVCYERSLSPVTGYYLEDRPRSRGHAHEP